MQNKLKQCPFCGVEPVTAVNYTKCGGGDLYLRFSVVCPECKTSRGVTCEVEGKSFQNYIEAMSKAIILWNKRADEDD